MKTYLIFHFSLIPLHLLRYKEKMVIFVLVIESEDSSPKASHIIIRNVASLYYWFLRKKSSHHWQPLKILSLAFAIATVIQSTAKGKKGFCFEKHFQFSLRMLAAAAVEKRARLWCISGPLSGQRRDGRGAVPKKKKIFNRDLSHGTH